jgi:hypothetical protein
MNNYMPLVSPKRIRRPKKSKSRKDNPLHSIHTGCIPDLQLNIEKIKNQQRTEIIVSCSGSHVQAGERELLGEQLGFSISDRDLLINQSELVRDDQQKASEQFKDALTQLKEIYGFRGSDLEEMYDGLSEDYQDIVERVEIVDEHIEKVQRIAGDLFAEWRDEIDEMANPDLRSRSRQKLKAT